MYFDSTYLLLVPGLILALLAQARVKYAYARYSRVQSRLGIPAAQAVQTMLRDNGNHTVSVRRVPGQLTDHYDPRDETLSLSEGVYGSTSVAALGIAAHEAGHAMQKKEGYAFLGLRTALVPAVNFGSKLSVPVFILGLIMSLDPLVTAGIVLFAATVLFTLITLPVELDASRRAVKMLTAGGMVTAEEERGVRSVLSAAALTYVASAVGAVLQLLRLILIAQNRRRRD